MTPTETTTILRQFNEWRRGDEDIPQFDPREIGEAIDAAVEMIDRLEAAEKERDKYKSAYTEWCEKTEWVQDGISNGSISPTYLGWHRADIAPDLLKKAENERDALQAKIEAMEQEPPRGWWDDLIADISAIDCMYRGSPTYAHDAYWMRDRVVWTLKQRRDSTPGVNGEAK